MPPGFAADLSRLAFCWLVVDQFTICGAKGLWTSSLSVLLRANPTANAARLLGSLSQKLKATCQQENLRPFIFPTQTISQVCCLLLHAEKSFSLERCVAIVSLITTVCSNNYLSFFVRWSLRYFCRLFQHHTYKTTKLCDVKTLWLRGGWGFQPLYSVGLGLRACFERFCQ